MTNPAEQKVTLPTGSLLAAAWIAALAAGAAWSVVAWAIGHADRAAAGPVAGAIVAGSATVALLVVGPWRPKTLYAWPTVWVAGSFVRMLITLAGTFLLYSATQFSGASLWLAVVLSYLAAMVGETRIYAKSMQRYGPGRCKPAEASTPE